MEYRISDTLDCLEATGQDLQPRGGNAARVRAKTFAKLHTEQSLSREESLHISSRRFRPLVALIAAAAAVLLLSGSVFAAWKLGAFRFTEALGPVAEPLDVHAQTYEPDDSQPIPASFGYASWVKAQAGDYNLTLLSLTASDGVLRATVDVSPRREGVPALRDSGLTLAFADYETDSTPPREVGPWKDRVELTATLTEALASDAEIVFSLFAPGREPALAVFSLDALDTAWQEMASSDRIRFATSAETKDYRFSLCTLTASPSTIYAVLDVEALTDFGHSNLDRIPELAVWNHTRQNSGSHLDARLVGSAEGLRRYLIGYLGSEPVNEVGDVITFEVMALLEEGDLEEHPYHLFDVELEDLVPDGLTLSDPQGKPTQGIAWLMLRVESTGIILDGLLNEGSDPSSCPSVTLIFRDGTEELILYDWGQSPKPMSEHFAETSDLVGRRDGSVRGTLSFRTLLDLTALAAVVVDGQTFPVSP